MIDDRKLRELFRSARAVDEASAPAFRDVVGRTPSRPVHARGRLLIGLAAAIVLFVGALLVPRRSARSSRADALRWEAPTDFLLAVPGRDLFQSTPRIGVPMPLESSYPESKKGIRT